MLASFAPARAAYWAAGPWSFSDALMSTAAHPPLSPSTVPFEHIGLHDGRDPAHAASPQWFEGWTARTPWGAVTFRLVYPNDFPRPDLWVGQLTVGSSQFVVNGVPCLLDAAAWDPATGARSATPEQPSGGPAPEIAATAAPPVEGAETVAPDDAPPLALVPRLNAANRTATPGAWLQPDPYSQDPVAAGAAVAAARPEVERWLTRLVNRLRAEIDHDRAEYWAAAYAWGIYNTRRLADEAGRSRGSEASEHWFQAREELLAAFGRSEWTREEVIAMMRHPRRELRDIGGRAARQQVSGTVAAPAPSPGQMPGR